MKNWIVKSECKILPIPIENLLAVTVENYLCTFHIENEPDFSCTKTLREAISVLPDYFVRINRHCIVNVKKVKSIELKDKTVLLSGNIGFPVSESCFKSLKDKIYGDNIPAK